MFQDTISALLVPWTLKIIYALLVLLAGRFVIKPVIKLLRTLLAKTGLDDILINFVGSLANAVFWLLVIIAALDQLGVDTTSLVALVGAAGLAVGLALQGSLRNFSAGFLLMVFRPFKAGDFIEAAGTSGIVEKISIFSTTLRTADNREIIVPNGAIYGGTITNSSAYPTRRIDMVFGIGYDDDIGRARQIIRNIIDADGRILKDPAPLIAVSELADSSVNFSVRPWVESGDYWAVKFDLTEKIKLAFDENNISIPYPQMGVHVDNSS